MHSKECRSDPRGWESDRPSIRFGSTTDKVVNNTSICIYAWKTNSMTKDSGFQHTGDPI